MKLSQWIFALLLSYTLKRKTNKVCDMEKVGLDTTKTSIKLVVQILSIVQPMELINKGMPSFYRIIYETGLAHGDNSYIVQPYCLIGRVREF